MTQDPQHHANEKAEGPSLVEMGEEVLNLSVGFGVAGMPLLLSALPAIVLLLPVLLLPVALALPVVAVAVLVAPPYLLVGALRRGRRGPRGVAAAAPVAE